MHLKLAKELKIESYYYNCRLLIYWKAKQILKKNLKNIFESFRNFILDYDDKKSYF